MAGSPIPVTGFWGKTNVSESTAVAMRLWLGSACCHRASRNFQTFVSTCMGVETGKTHDGCVDRCGDKFTIQYGNKEKLKLQKKAGVVFYGWRAPPPVSCLF